MIRPSIVKLLWLRELKELLRDRRALLLTLVLPMGMIPLVLVVPSLLGSAALGSPPRVQVGEGCPPALEEALAADVTVVHGPAEGEARAEALLRGKKAALVLDCRGSTVQAFYDPGRTASLRARTLAQAALLKTRLAMARSGLEARGLSPELAEPLHWTVRKVDPGAGFLATMLPFLLLMGLALTGLYHAVDTLAGEKERGTLQTLLSAPTSPGELALAKGLAILTSSLATAAASFVALLLVAVLVESASLPMGVPRMGGVDVVLAGGAVIGLAVLVTVAMMSVAVMARTVKEGQSMTTPVAVALFVPCNLAMIPGLKLGAATAAVPMLNLLLLMRDCLQGSASPGLGLFALGASLGWAALGLRVTAQIFRSEQVLLSGEKPWLDVFSRKRGPEDRLIPGSALLFTVLAFGLYLAGLKLLGKRLPFGVALVAAQVGLLFVPALLWARQAGCRWRDAFGLRAPSRRGWAETLPWLLLVPAFQRVADALMTWGFPVEAPRFGAEQATLLLGLSDRLGLVATVALIALTPAVCEELVFRGLVLRGLSRARSRWVPLLGSALLFGAFHVQPMQAIPAAVLGVLLAHVALRSRSILPGMALHFAVNALAVLAVVEGGPLLGPSWALLLAGLGLAGLAAVPVHARLSLDRAPGSGSSPAR